MLDLLMTNCKEIHYFGLGFIQIKINDKLRFHFYTDLDAKNIEQPHTHRYDFKSTILAGKLTETVYDVVDGNTHVLTNVTCKAGDRPVEARDCMLKISTINNYNMGVTYHRKNHEFHTVSSKFCVTKVERDEIIKEHASAVYAHGKSFNCPFETDVSEEQCWSIVRKMIEDGKLENYKFKV